MQNEAKNDVLYQAFYAIMNDKRSSSGLYHVLSNMYNHNKRRLPDILKEIVLTPNNIDIIKEYLKWWNIAISKNRTAHIKYLCRKAILRLFYNRYELKGLFERFGVDRKNGRSEYASYARKALTYLYQNNPTNKKDDYENYIMLEDLVSNVILPAEAVGFSGIRPPNIKHLAKMLFLMTDTKMVPHNWSPLVEIISTEDVSFTEASLLNTISTEKCKEYRIKITDAGRAYALLNADFEYFACRYDDARCPLFSATTQKKGDRYYCLDIIRNVRKNATKCIDKLIESDGRFFQSASNENMYIQMSKRKLLFLEIPHPVRIIRHHVGYLQAYKRFIDQNVQFDDPATKKEISEGIHSEICGYIKTISELLKINNDSNEQIKHFKPPFNDINGWIAQAQQYLDNTAVDL